MTSSTASSLPLAPPPWTCKCEVYVLSFYNSASTGIPLNTAYDPLEANTAAFSSEKDAGEYRGGLCMAQIIRYSETPVGRYDELAILPGTFSGVGRDGAKRRDSRITGIWVSSKESLINGRRNWNIPKHIARFAFTPTGPSSSMTKLEVFRPDPSSTRPFFTATIQPINYVPSFPFSSTWLGYLGLSTHILQPPLPAGDPADLVVKTEGWRRFYPSIRCGKAKLVWFDMKQPGEGQKTNDQGQSEGDALLAKTENENWWPGLRRWNLGIYLPGSTLELGEPEILMG